MNIYYIFNISKLPLAEQLLPQRTGQGFFDFKLHQKAVRQTALPLSSLQAEHMVEYRPVLILETDFAEEDEQIRAAAEAESEFFSQSAESVHNYLASLDVTNE